MNEFKLYDYIVEKVNRNNYFQLENVALVNEFNKNGGFELYIPQLGELCYFFDNGDKYPTIGKYQGIDGDNKFKSDVGTPYTKYCNCIGEYEDIDYTWHICVPFGELPIQFRHLIGE